MEEVEIWEVYNGLRLIWLNIRFNVGKLLNNQLKLHDVNISFTLAIVNKSPTKLQQYCNLLVYRQTNSDGVDGGEEGIGLGYGDGLSGGGKHESWQTKRMHCYTHFLSMWTNFMSMAWMEVKTLVAPWTTHSLVSGMATGVQEARNTGSLRLHSGRNDK